MSLIKARLINVLILKIDDISYIEVALLIELIYLVPSTYEPGPTS
jgi:hypothetical protein